MIKVYTPEPCDPETWDAAKNLAHDMLDVKHGLLVVMMAAAAMAASYGVDRDLVDAQWKLLMDTFTERLAR